MLESFISKRVQFPEGKQKSFIEFVQSKSGKTLKEISDYLAISVRTVSDWKREKYFITESSLQKMCDIISLPIPKDITLLEPYWNVSKAGKVGGRAKYKKYGNVASSEKKRKEKWKEWWEKEGRDKTIELFTKKIQIPKKSESLAEFIGIMLGDGGVAPYHISVTLDSKKDKEYAVYVSSLIINLFGIEPKWYYRKNARALNLNVGRRELVQFCNSQGLPIGDKLKQGILIPDWIMENRKYSRACIRGLVDTDGCFFNHKYRVNKKEYSYTKIDFTSRSVPLLSQVESILQKEGLCVRLSASRSCVRIESKEGVQKYMKNFGTNNLKHQGKIQ